MSNIFRIEDAIDQARDQLCDIVQDRMLKSDLYLVNLNFAIAVFDRCRALVDQIHILDPEESARLDAMLDNDPEPPTEAEIALMRAALSIEEN